MQDLSRVGKHYALTGGLKAISAANVRAEGLGVGDVFGWRIHRIPAPNPAQASQTSLRDIRRNTSWMLS